MSLLTQLFAKTNFKIVEINKIQLRNFVVTKSEGRIVNGLEFRSLFPIQRGFSLLNFLFSNCP